MFTPHTQQERDDMLHAVGAKHIEDLFEAIPKAHLFPKLNLPPSMTEMEVMAQLQDLANANESTREMACFLGAGAYNHYIPAAVDSLLRRGEFFTAYTPYQPEISQGTLQAIFEFQSLISSLTGMEAANASHYDGATATAEAGILAYHHFRGKKTRFVVSPAVHPHYRATLRTYFAGYKDFQIIGDEKNAGQMTTSDLTALIDKNTAMVLVQYPDFFGRIVDYSSLADAAHAAGALFVVAANPIALGLLKPPGTFGADIVVGEGQPLGIPLSYGGPYLGFFTTKMDYIRKIAGRVVGESVDGAGNRGYVLTLTAREQHIRREKATSNICTNQGLMALAATIYMSLLGKNGIKKVAELCYHKAHYAAEKINAIPGFSVKFNNSPFFHEFVVKTTRPVQDINMHLLEHHILGGLDLGEYYEDLKNHMLIAVTEMNSKDDIDLLCDVLSEVDHE
jgi:glycine dehydrogenase subunit 1